MILRLGSHLRFGEAACSNRASGPYLFCFFFPLLLVLVIFLVFADGVALTSFIQDQ
jgi:hypothetical protein